MNQEDVSPNLAAISRPMRPGHGFRLRKEESVPLGVTLKHGRFGRMFGHLSPLVVAEGRLLEFGKLLGESKPGDPLQDNPNVPAGYTYLGQFIDHDITFDPTPLPERILDPLAIFNFRTPRLDLDSLYGTGPADQPYLYERDRRAKFLLGTNPESLDQNGKVIPALPNDLPRNSEGYALIGDPRNDENLIVAQLHLAFLKFHNAVLDSLDPDPIRQLARFDDARRLVTWHYQWIVLHDFLERLLAPNAVNDVIRSGCRFFKFDGEPFMPVEFSVAAYRFGHSMVRNGYNHNRVFNFEQGALSPATLALLFFFTGPQKAGPPVSAPVPSNWVIDWRRFFDFKASGIVPNLSRRLDPLLAPELQRLVENHKVDIQPSSLAARNLIRGVKVSLPSGQDVAAAIEAKPLTAAQLSSEPDGAELQKAGMVEATPLWYYLLKEAAVLGEGVRLGRVGSTILAEVFVGLLRGDPNSFLSQQPGWQPTLPSAEKGKFTMVDLLRFADGASPVVNAIDDPRSAP